MDLHRVAASLVVIGFDGHSVSSEASELIAQGVSGAIFFRRNIESWKQVAELCARIKQKAARPFACCIDQEGGRVARLRGQPFTKIPTMRAIGDADDESLAYDVGRVLGREVRAAGFDVDFAPVLDIDSNQLNPVIGDRSIAGDASKVSRLGVALASGIEKETVASCGKHFPGHGDTSQDSHCTLPVLEHTMQRLSARELIPFRAYVKENLASIMTAHVVIREVESDLPATFSRKLIADWLTTLEGFKGLVVSDDLEMKAIASHYSAEEAAVRAVLAGVNWLLICHRAESQQQAIDGLVREARSSTVFRRYLLASSEKISRFLERFTQLPPAWDQAQVSLQDPQHLARVARILKLRPKSVENLPDPTSAMAGFS